MVPALFFLVWFVYYISVIYVVVSDNHSASVTLAWLLVLLFIPFVGILLYLFAGRNRHSFKNEITAKETLAKPLKRFLAPIRNNHTYYKRKIKKTLEFIPYGHIVDLIEHNSESLLTYNRKVTVLQNANQKYPKLLSDLIKAEKSIHMEYFIWSDDEFTQKIKAILIEKAQKGIEVRCLYDESASNLTKTYVTELRAAGVKIYPYRSFVSLKNLREANYRGHRKIVILDGRVGYVGGMNLDHDQIDGGKYFDSWRDTQIRVVGEGAQALQSIFIENWYETTKENIARKKYFPPVSKLQKGTPIHFTSSGPDSKWPAIRQLYFNLIVSAKRTIRIQSPFFIPDDSIREALKVAALSGIDVQMIMAERGSGPSFPYWAANTYFAELVQAGVKVFLYKKGYFHAKTVMIDGVMGSVGTANMDIRSFSINFEVNTVIYDKRIARKIEKDFEQDRKDSAAFSLKEYNNKSRVLKFRDSLCRVLSPIM